MGHSVRLLHGPLGAAWQIALAVVVMTSGLWLSWRLHVPLDRSGGGAPLDRLLHSVVVDGIFVGGFVLGSVLIDRMAARFAAREEAVLGAAAGAGTCPRCGAPLDRRVGRAAMCAYCASPAFGDAAALDRRAAEIHAHARAWREAIEVAREREEERARRRAAMVFTTFGIVFLAAALLAALAGLLGHPLR